MTKPKLEWRLQSGNHGTVYQFYFLEIILVGWIEKVSNWEAFLSDSIMKRSLLFLFIMLNILHTCILNTKEHIHPRPSGERFMTGACCEFYINCIKGWKI